MQSKFPHGHHLKIVMSDLLMTKGDEIRNDRVERMGEWDRGLEDWPSSFCRRIDFCCIQESKDGKIIPSSVVELRCDVEVVGKHLRCGLSLGMEREDRCYMAPEDYQWNPLTSVLWDFFDPPDVRESGWISVFVESASLRTKKRWAQFFFKLNIAN